MNNVYICIFLLFNQFVLFAQDDEYDDPRIFMPEVGISLFAPTGTHADFQNDNGYGLELGIHFQLSADQPFTLGLIGTYHFQSYERIFFFDEIGGIEEELKESMTNQVVSILGTFRYYLPLAGEFKVYSDFLIGPKIFLSTKNLSDTGSGDLVNEFDIQSSDLSFSYGLGLGVQKPLWGFTYLNAKASYVPGVSAGYFTTKQNRPVNPVFVEDVFTFRNSSTESFYFTLGLSFFL